MIEEKEFYSLFSAQKSREAVLKSNFSCDFFSVVLDEEVFDIPVKTKIVLGRVMYDMIDFNDGINFVISDRFLNLLLENNLTGWKTYPVEIKNSNEKYYGFQIIGKCGPLKKNKLKGFFIGHEFDRKTWDGTDFFSPDKTQLRFMSKKAKEVLSSGKLTNLNIENIKFSEYYSKGEK